MLYKVWAKFTESVSDGVIVVDANSPDDAKRVIMLSADTLGVSKIIGEPVEYMGD